MFGRAARWGKTMLPTTLGGSTGNASVGAWRVPADFEELVEGMGRVIFRRGHVFYNPVQVVNRDLSVLMLRWLQRQRPDRPLKVLEALSATGLRAIRYAREIPNVSEVVANDLDPGAVETITRNVSFNGGEVARIVRPNCGDAIDVMTAARTPEKQFDVVDLDPYGGAAPFLDSAVQAVADGGVLAVTCTDLAVLCGNSPEICFARYGSAPLKGPATHEMAVRIVLFAINAAANRHGRSIEVLACCKIDFYVRLFVRVRNSKSLAQLSHSRSCAVYQCSTCGTQRFQNLGRVKENVVSNTKKRKRKEAARVEELQKSNGATSESRDTPQPGSATNTAGIRKFSVGVLGEDVSSRCKVCDGPMAIGGPIWSGPLVDVDVTKDILREIESGSGAFQARDRVAALLGLLNEEVPHAPLFMQLNAMCGVLKVSAPPAASIRSYLISKGYAVSQSHTDPLALKTDAPPEVLWDLLRLWTKASKKGDGKSKKARITSADENKHAVPTAHDRIMSTAVMHVVEEDVDFSIKKDRFVRNHGLDDKKKAARFLPNPERNWGPKARARSGVKRTINGDQPAR